MEIRSRLAKTKLQTILIVAIMMVGLFVGISLLASFTNISASTQKNITSNGSTIEGGTYDRKNISFPCSGVQCSGWLYIPSDLRPRQKIPGIVTANPITAVKQIASPNYAERLAQAGFAALVLIEVGDQARGNLETM